MRLDKNVESDNKSLMCMVKNTNAFEAIYKLKKNRQCLYTEKDEY